MKIGVTKISKDSRSIISRFSDVNREDDGVRAGLLLFTLKDYNLGRSNTFIGEALVPLSDLPCVDSSEVHTVPNTYLKMTTPGLDNGKAVLASVSSCQSTSLCVWD